MPQKSSVLSNVFLEITKVAQACISQACNSKNFFELRTILQVLNQLPSSTEVSSDLFAGVAATAQAWLIAAQNTRNSSEALKNKQLSRVTSIFIALDLLPLPRGTELTAHPFQEAFTTAAAYQVFLETATLLRQCVIDAIKDKPLQDTKLLLETLEMLPITHYQSSLMGNVVDVAKACVVQALDQRQLPNANRVFRILPTIRE
ncbi:hypothetical protein HBH97_252660 [Parastagonospora nodorum]|nr:hypothetical protein HBH97_252660 [Parastagonospora nodorum]